MADALTVTIQQLAGRPPEPTDPAAADQPAALFWTGIAPGTWESDGVAIRGDRNAVVVELIPSGTSPSATATVIDSADVATGFMATADPAGTRQAADTAYTKFLVAGLLPHIKIRLVVTAGVWAVRVTPVFAGPVEDGDSLVGVQQLTATADTEVIAGVVGQQICLRSLIATTNYSTAAVEVALKDGNGGTVKFRAYAGAGYRPSKPVKLTPGTGLFAALDTALSGSNKLDLTVEYYLRRT